MLQNVQQLLYATLWKTTPVCMCLWNHKLEHEEEQEKWLLSTTGKHSLMKEWICTHLIWEEEFDKLLNTFSLTWELPLFQSCLHSKAVLLSNSSSHSDAAPFLGSRAQEKWSLNDVNHDKDVQGSGLCRVSAEYWIHGKGTLVSLLNFIIVCSWRAGLALRASGKGPLISCKGNTRFRLLLKCFHRCARSKNA